MTKTTQPDLPTDAPRTLYGAPVGTPPGGGRWTWSAEQAAWVPRQDEPAQDTPTAQYTESPQE